jgi:hypothetical protein
MQGCKRKLLEKEKPFFGKKKLKFEIIIIFDITASSEISPYYAYYIRKNSKKIEN